MSSNPPRKSRGLDRSSDHNRSSEQDRSRSPLSNTNVNDLHLPCQFECGKHFTNERNKDRHERFRCTKRKSSFNGNILPSHESLGLGKNECRICNYKSTRNDKAKRHEIQSHGVQYSETGIPFLPSSSKLKVRIPTRAPSTPSAPSPSKPPDSISLSAPARSPPDRLDLIDSLFNESTIQNAQAIFLDMSQVLDISNILDIPTDISAVVQPTHCSSDSQQSTEALLLQTHLLQPTPTSTVPTLAAATQTILQDPSLVNQGKTFTLNHFESLSIILTHFESL